MSDRRPTERKETMKMRFQVEVSAPQGADYPDYRKRVQQELQGALLPQFSDVNRDDPDEWYVTRVLLGQIEGP